MSTTIEPTNPPHGQSSDTQRIPADSPLAPYVWIDRERLSGAPCFAGTRVPLQNLHNYLTEGYSLAEFLDDFEGVTREQAQEVLRLAWEALMEKLPKA